MAQLAFWRPLWSFRNGPIAPFSRYLLARSKLCSARSSTLDFVPFVPILKMSGQRSFHQSQGRRNMGPPPDPGTASGSSSSNVQAAAPPRPQKQPKPPPPNYPSYNWQEALTPGPGAGARSLHYITNLRDAEHMIPQIRGWVCVWGHGECIVQTLTLLARLVLRSASMSSGGLTSLK